VASRIGRPRRRTLALVIAVVVVVVTAGGAWYLQPQQLLPEAQASLGAKPDTAFQKLGDNYEWMPPSMHYSVGLVVYPGAKVPPAAYGPLAQRIAAHGYLVVVVSMPLNMAVLDIDAATAVMAAHPEVTRWAIAGHSLGGAMAAQFVASHPDVMRGLALWASYPGTDLSSSGVACASIYGTLDAGADQITSAESKARLPADCAFVAIQGGNHEQMGYYTGQPNDPPATISRDDQQTQVAQATLEMLARVQAQPDQFPAPSPAPAGSGAPSTAPSGS
jgi:pimeloyl-ACP methyl ester carboxylesterase